VKGGVVKGKFETNANHNNVMLLSDHQESRADAPALTWRG
jgi:hypothetical protein